MIHAGVGMKHNNKKLRKLKKIITNKKFILFFIIVIILILVGIYSIHNYLEKIKKENYKLGGKEAIFEIVSVIRESGGAVLTLEDNDTITLVKYGKGN